jgi:uncharacterized phage protein (TIGR01671 family)
MREILFRGKRTDDGEWVEGYYQEYPEGYVHIQNTSNDWFPVIPETVGQFTGLLDKNGKKIFEGDIVSELWEWQEKGKENYYIVRWDNGSCGFEPFSDSLENCGHCGGGINPKECEVIGNIHDNPDLMVDNNTIQIERMAEYMKKMTMEFMKSST